MPFIKKSPNRHHEPSSLSGGLHMTCSVVDWIAVAHRVAATESIVQRGRPVPRGELHAYLQGRSTSLCGRSIGDDLISFDVLRWSARPLGLATCKICFSRAR
jgi:hypothetical protein